MPQLPFFVHEGAEVKPIHVFQPHIGKNQVERILIMQFKNLRSTRGTEEF